MCFDDTATKNGWNLIFQGLYSTVDNKYTQGMNYQIEQFWKKKAEKELEQ